MSLYVALEITKLVLAYMIHRDKALFDPKTGHNALPRNSDIIEEVGQVEIVFSDKTGTLTCNEMCFVRGSVKGQVIGPRTNEDLEAMREQMKSKKMKQPTYHLEGDTTPYVEAFELGNKEM